MNIENVKVGDKFPTKNKLKIELGLIPKKGKQSTLQDKEIARYLTYELTGKPQKNDITKISSEIVITEIYETPLQKIDGRCSDYIIALSNVFKYLKSGRYTTSMLMKECGLIEDTKTMDVYEEFDNNIKTYKCNLKSEFKRKAISTLNKLQKDGLISYKQDCYYLIEDEKQMFCDFRLANDEEVKKIKTIEKELKKKYEKEKNKKFDSLKYNNKFYKEYCEKRTEILQKEMNIYSFILAFEINNTNSVHEYKKSNSISIIDLFEKRMAHLIETYKYDANKSKREEISKNKTYFGLRETNLYKEVEYVYPLQCKEVYKFHKEIFHKDYMPTEQKEENPIEVKDIINKEIEKIESTPSTPNNYIYDWKVDLIKKGYIQSANSEPERSVRRSRTAQIAQSEEHQKIIEQIDISQLF